MSNAELRRDPQVVHDYGDLLALFRHPIERGAYGVIRWKKSRLQSWLCDHVDLNQLAVAVHRKEVPEDEYMKFYRDIGYSLSGYIEVFGEKLGLYSEA